MSVCPGPRQKPWGEVFWLEEGSWLTDQLDASYLGSQSFKEEPALRLWWRRRTEGDLHLTRPVAFAPNCEGDADAGWDKVQVLARQHLARHLMLETRMGEAAGTPLFPMKR